MKRSYIEVASGLNFFDEATGQWTPTREEWEVFEGGIVARFGQQKVILSHNLNQAGSVDILSPAGVRLTGNPVAMGWFDPVDGKHLILANVVDCEAARPVQGPVNEIFFPDCFDNVRASIRMTYRKSGLAQDVLIEEPLVLPQGFSDRTRLEIYTEWDPEVPLPRQTVRTVREETDPQVRAQMIEPDLTDVTLAWDGLIMGRGRAFTLDSEASSARIPVLKRFEVIDGRPVLIEAVEFTAIEPLFARLQVNWGAAKGSALADARVHSAVSIGRQVPRRSREQAKLRREALDGPKVEIAGYRPVDGAVVSDYTTVSGILTNYSFAAGQTYFINGYANLVSAMGLSNVFEGGTVLKYALNATIDIAGDTRFATSFYAPVHLTAWQDDSVGEKISGSTNNPVPSAEVALFCGDPDTPLTVEHLRVAYAQRAIDLDNYPATNRITHCQLLRCNEGVALSSGYLQLGNALAYKVGAVFAGTRPVWAEHLTIHESSLLADDWGALSLYLTNSLLVAVTNLGTTATNGSHFYWFTNDPGVFQTAGAGAHYLVNDTYRGVGTTNVSFNLLAAFKQTTTRPPMILSNLTFTTATNLAPVIPRYSGGNPDIGWQYPVLDYCAGGVVVTDAALTLKKGVVVGTFGSTPAILVTGTGSIQAQGTATDPVMIPAYHCVQEQANTNWSSLLSDHLKIVPPESSTRLRFTTMTSAGRKARVWIENKEDVSELVHRFEHCNFIGTEIALINVSAAFTNCLLQRQQLALNPTESPLTISLNNCLLLGGEISAEGGDGQLRLHNNLFERTVIAKQAGTIVHNYNAYLTNYDRFTNGAAGPNDVVLTNAFFPFTNGALGSFYHAITNLVDRGSMHATNAGLMHFTTQPGGGKDTGSVDIGFHYVATTNGAPFDSDNDGAPDYIEDVNGNGTVNAGESDWLNNQDSDYDGRSDGEEWLEGTDPADPHSFTPVRIGYWHFNDTNWLGQWNQPPIATNLLQLTRTWINHGVQYPASNSVLRYKDIESDGKANINCRSGSLVVWFKPDGVWSSGPGHPAVLCKLGSDQVEGLWRFRFEPGGTNFLFMSASNNAVATNLLVTNMNMAVGKWHHLVLTWSPTNCSFWTNGVLAASNNVGVSLYPNAAVRSQYGFSVGCNDVGNNAIRGLLEDLETFNYPLSQTEITNHFQVTRPPSLLPGLVGWYIGDAGIEFVVATNTYVWYDQSGLGNDFSQQGGFSNRVPAVQINALNGHDVLEFDGTNDYLRRHNTPFNFAEAEIFVVHKVLRAPGGTNGFWTFGNASGTRYPDSNGRIMDNFGAPGLADSGVPFIALTNFHLYNAYSRPDEWASRLNGLLHFIRRTQTVVWPQTVHFGGDISGGSGSNYFHGQIAEVLLFTNVFSDVDRHHVGTYLNQKYAFITNTPAAPSNLVARAVSAGQISLTWHGTHTNWLTRYLVERKSAGGEYNLVARVDADTCWFDTGLAANTAYTYRVRATNYHAGSEWSAEATATTLAGAADLPFTNLVMWLRADAGIARQTTNHTVAVWVDQSGNRNDGFQQAGIATTPAMGTNQPVFLFMETNGHPAVGFNLTNDFNGTNDFLFLGRNGTNFANLTEGEIYIVHRAAKTNGSNNGFWNFGQGQTGTRYPNTLSQIIDNFGSSNRLHQAGVPGSADLAQYHLYRVVAKPGTWTNWHNETLLLATNVNTVKFPASGSSAQIGRSVTPTVPFEGSIQEILFFSPMLQGDQTNSVKRYLREKYNLW